MHQNKGLGLCPAQMQRHWCCLGQAKAQLARLSAPPLKVHNLEACVNYLPVILLDPQEMRLLHTLQHSTGF